MSRRPHTTCLLPLLLASVSLTSLSSAQQLRFDLVVDGLDDPSMLTTPPGDQRLFICERELGLVLVYDGTTLLPTPFLDISANFLADFERGLLGLAFHPDYATNGFVYVSYTDLNGASVIERYTVSSTDPNVVDPSTAQIVFGPLAQSQFIHNGGCLAFGSDGMLYLSLGDDNLHPNGQDLSTAKGKILRLDVDAPFPHVPQDNPFVGQPGVEELIWVYGLRNPWRFSFDALTGEMWIGDVGAAERDEIDIVDPVTGAGSNFGWSCLEGTQCTSFLPAVAGCDCTDPTIAAPVYERNPYSVGCSIIGGHVYRGQQVPSMAGRYVFSDWCGGVISSFEWNGTTFTDLVVDHAITPSGVQATSISEGPGRELYLTDMNGGRVFKLVEDCSSYQYCTANPNSTGVPGETSFVGTGSVSANDFTLVGSDLPPGSNGYFVASQTEAFVMNPGGSQGNLCLGLQGIARFSLFAGPADSMGRYLLSLDLTAFPTNPPQVIQPGDTWKFQLWHRDLNPTVTSNFTTALSVTFCP